MIALAPADAEFIGLGAAMLLLCCSVGAYALSTAGRNFDRTMDRLSEAYVFDLRGLRQRHVDQFSVSVEEAPAAVPRVLSAD